LVGRVERLAEVTVGRDLLAHEEGDRADQLGGPGVGEGRIHLVRDGGHVAGGEGLGERIEAGEVLDRERQHGERLIARRGVGEHRLHHRPGHGEGEEDVGVALVGSAAAAGAFRRDLGLDGTERAPDELGLGVGQAFEALGELHLVADRAQADGDVAVRLPEVRRDGVGGRRGAEELCGGVGHGGELSRRSRQVRRRGPVIAVAAHGDRDAADQRRRQDQWHQEEDPAGHPAPGVRRRRIFGGHPRSSAPSLPAAAVTFVRTSATSASVRLRSAACNRSR
jgi:hypothetical protein